MKKLLAGAALAAAAFAPAAQADVPRNTYVCIEYTYIYVNGRPVPTVRSVSITSYPVCDVNIPLP